MNKKQKQLADQIYDESLSRIRQRLSGFSSTGLSQMQSINTFRLGMTEMPKERTSGFSGKLDSLDKQCKILQQDINQLNAKQRNLGTRFRFIKEDLFARLEKIQKSTDGGVAELAVVVKQGIAQAIQRRKKIEQEHYQNVQASNNIKVNIADLRNKINEIQHRLGCNATIWQKI